MFWGVPLALITQKYSWGLRTKQIFEEKKSNIMVVLMWIIIIIIQGAYIKIQQFTPIFLIFHADDDYNDCEKTAKCLLRRSVSCFIIFLFLRIVC